MFVCATEIPNNNRKEFHKSLPKISTIIATNKRKLV